MSHPHNSHFGVTSSTPHFAVKHIAACCVVTLHCMPDTVVLLRDFDIFWVPFFLVFIYLFIYLLWLDYRCNQPDMPHLRRSDSLFSPTSPLLFWFQDHSAKFWNLSLCLPKSRWVKTLYIRHLSVCQAWTSNQLYCNLSNEFREKIDCLGFISRAPHSLDGWRLLAQDRVRRESYSEH